MHEHSVTCRRPVSRLVHYLGHPASVITWKNFNRGPGFTVLGSQLTGPARLSWNCKGDCFWLWLRCRDLCKASPEPGHVSFMVRFYAPFLMSSNFQSPPNRHTQNFSLPNNFTTPLLHIKWTFPYSPTLQNTTKNGQKKTILNLQKV